MPNQNGYVVYPSSTGIMNLQKARNAAREESPRNGAARVEDCGNENVVARFKNGREVDRYPALSPDMLRRGYR